MNRVPLLSHIRPSLGLSLVLLLTLAPLVYLATAPTAAKERPSDHQYEPRHHDDSDNNNNNNNNRNNKNNRNSNNNNNNNHNNKNDGGGIFVISQDDEQEAE